MTPTISVAGLGRRSRDHQAHARPADGADMAYFRLPSLRDGPWYQSWLTAATAFVLLLVYGMWYGLVYRRAGLPGTAVFGATQFAALGPAAIVLTWLHGWSRLGRFLTDLTAIGVTGVLAVAVAVMLAGGFATIRRLPL